MTGPDSAFTKRTITEDRLGFKMGYQTETKANLEHQLWRDAVKGDTHAYEQVVVRYQSAVSAVAYSIVGDFAASQDIAQETFWAAWSARDRLLDSHRLGAWLCGIARNLAKQWRRKKFRSAEVEHSPKHPEPSAVSQDPVDQFISEEEETVVWASLEKIPENYREVLVGYYRHGKSIEEVARSMGLSNAAARQRLSRGREMLRVRVSQMIEGVLDRSNPTRTFTSRVMAGIVGTGFAAQAASASAAGMSSAAKVSTATVGTAKLLASGMGGGLLGGLIGVVGGLGGAWIGNWLPAQLAPTETERQLLLVRARPMFRFAVLQAVGVLVLTLLFVFVRFHWMYFLVGMIGLVVPFIFFTIVHTIRTQVLVAQLRKEISPEEDPNRSSLAKRIKENQSQPGKRIRGRRYTSTARLFGIPLIDVQVSDPVSQHGSKTVAADRGVARGWIAIGDVAYGLLLAIGGRATGMIAMGGFSVGLLSVGGAAIGLVSLGGVGIGVMAFGGLAIGYTAVGGGAVAWHSAVGGGAIAYKMAAGGAAIAREFAVGGAAFAAEANTQLARDTVTNNSFAWMLEQRGLSIWITVIAFAPLVFTPLFYRRSGSESETEDGKPGNGKDTRKPTW